MAGQYMDGPSWDSIFGNIASDYANAPAKALGAMELAQRIKDQKAEAARKQTIFDAGVQNAQTFSDLIPETPPQAYQNMAGPYIGDPASPIDSQAIGLPHGPVPVPTDPIAAATYKAQRALVTGAGRQSAISGHPEQLLPAYAQGTALMQGRPDDQAARDQQEFLTTGKWPKHDESENPPKTATVVGPNGPTGQTYGTRDFKNDLTGAPIPLQPDQRLVPSSPVSPTAPNPLESVAVAQNQFRMIAEKVRNGTATSQDMTLAQSLRPVGWPQSVEFKEDPETKQYRPFVKYNQQPPADGPMADLFRLLDQTPQAPGQPPPPQPPPPDPNAVPGAKVGAAITAGDASGLRDQYNNLPAVSLLEKAKTGYSSIVANMPYDNHASDLAIVIGASKVLDPQGVVRPTESKEMEGTPGPKDQMYGFWNYVNSGARLDTRARYQIMQMVNAKLEKDIAMLAPVREQYAVLARQRGLNPDEQFPAMLQLSPLDAKKINSIKTPADVGADPAAAASARPLQQQAPNPYQDLDAKLGVN